MEALSVSGFMVTLPDIGTIVSMSWDRDAFTSTPQILHAIESSIFSQVFVLAKELNKYGLRAKHLNLVLTRDQKDPKNSLAIVLIVPHENKENDVKPLMHQLVTFPSKVTKGWFDSTSPGSEVIKKAIVSGIVFRASYDGPYDLQGRLIKAVLKLLHEPNADSFSLILWRSEFAFLTDVAMQIVNGRSPDEYQGIESYTASVHQALKHSKQSAAFFPKLLKLVWGDEDLQPKVQISELIKFKINPTELTVVASDNDQVNPTDVILSKKHLVKALLQVSQDERRSHFLPKSLLFELSNGQIYPVVSFGPSVRYRLPIGFSVSADFEWYAFYEFVTKAIIITYLYEQNPSMRHFLLSVTLYAMSHNDIDAIVYFSRYFELIVSLAIMNCDQGVNVKAFFYSLRLPDIFGVVKARYNETDGDSIMLNKVMAGLEKNFFRAYFEFLNRQDGINNLRIFIQQFLRLSLIPPKGN